MKFCSESFYQKGSTLIASVLRMAAIALFLFCVYVAYTFIRGRLISGNITYDVAFRAKSILTEVGLDKVPTEGYKIPNYAQETEYGYPVQIYGIREEYMIPNGFVIEVHEVPSDICRKVLKSPLKDVRMRLVDSHPYRGDENICGEKKKVILSFIYELPVMEIRTIVPGAVRNLACKTDADCGDCAICDGGICGDDLSAFKMTGDCCDKPTGRKCCPLKDSKCICQPAAGCR